MGAGLSKAFAVAITSNSRAVAEVLKATLIVVGGTFSAEKTMLFVGISFLYLRHGELNATEAENENHWIL